MFARSVFQSVLERLQADDAVAPEDVPSVRIPGLGAGFAAETQPAAAGDAIHRAYADIDELDSAPPLIPSAPLDAPAKEPDPPPVPQPPAHLARLLPEEIAADLGIAPDDTPARLAERRRAFAALNHPDRHDEAWRPAATQRMTQANMLVDEALRRWRRAQSTADRRARPRRPA